MASNTVNLSTYNAKGWLSVSKTANNTNNLLYINTTDNTTWTADTLGTTTSIAFTRANITGAYTTGHIVWLNANDIGTPFQLVVHDSSDLYLYKRYKSSGTWTEWTKMRAGTADAITTAGTTAQFYRGDNTWSNTLTGPLYIGTNTNRFTVHPNGLCYKGTSYDFCILRVIDGGSSWGHRLVIGAAGGLGESGNGGQQVVIGAGESAGSYVDAVSTNDESLHLLADGTIFLQAGADTIANRKGFAITSASEIIPVQADTYKNGAGTLGTNGYRWGHVYTDYLHSTNYIYAGSYVQAAANMYMDTGHFYMKYNDTWYDVLHNHGNGNVSVNAASVGLYVGYYNTTLVDFMSGKMQLKDGCLSLFPTSTSYREGLRIHSVSSWSDITLCGNDNTGDSGISANSWFIGNNNGKFYIARNGSPGSTAWLGCVDNVWKVYGNQSNSKNKQQSILHIYGPTYGNTAADMISGTAGLFSWGDGGPQITFDTSATPGGGQAGALIFTDHDTAGTGVSWHFVSNQTDWTVTSKHFKALTDFDGPLIHSAGGVSYISGAKGNNATVYAKKATGSVWRPAVCLQTSGAGSWQIGNYNDETLEFQYATKANIDSQNNSTSEIYMQNGDTGRVITTGNYSTWIVPETGGTFSGNVLIVTDSADHYFEVKSNATGVRLELDNSGSTNHGLWSSGYWNGSAYTASSSWMIYRNASGTTIVNGNCTGSSGSCTGNAATATKATQDGSGNTITSTYAKLSGATFTGNIAVAKASGAVFSYVRRTDTGLECELHINSGSTNHGVYSNGYYSGSAFTSDGKWLIYRNSSGVVTVNGNCTGSSGSCTGDAAGLTGGLVTNTVTSHGNLAVTTAKGSYYGINLGHNASGMSIMSINASHQGLYNQTNGQWILYYNAASNSKSIVIGNSTVNITGGISLNLNTKITGSLEMTGNQTITGAGAHWTKWVNTTTGVSIEMWSDTTNQGIYTRGYWTGSAYTASAGWILYRGTDSYLHTQFRLYGAVWNDYAEFRKGDVTTPGRVVIEQHSGIMTLCNERLAAGAKIISDTYGFAIGETKECKTPIAVSGRVLVYPYRNRNKYELGAAVCSAPRGTIDIMTREEIKEYPERIIGTVSEIPEYEIWHCNGNAEQGLSDEVKVDGRIWIYVR